MARLQRTAFNGGRSIEIPEDAQGTLPEWLSDYAYGTLNNLLDHFSAIAFGVAGGRRVGTDWFRWNRSPNGALALQSE